jgi:hypothetical protein
MDQTTVSPKSQFIAEIDEAWETFNSYLVTLNGNQMTTLHDERGWSVKDHLTHIIAWEQSINYYLQGKLRHEALQVEAAMLNNQDFDTINEVIRSQRGHISLNEVLVQLQQTHAELMELVKTMSDEDLTRPHRDYPPGTPASEQHSVMDLIRGDTSEHFDEHLHWIKSLVEKASA